MLLSCLCSLRLRLLKFLFYSPLVGIPPFIINTVFYMNFFSRSDYWCGFCVLTGFYMIQDRYGDDLGINPKIQYFRISLVMFVCLSRVLGSLPVGSEMLTICINST